MPDYGALAARLPSVDRQKFKLNKHRRFFIPVLDPDYPVSIGCTHCARSEIHQVAVVSHQFDGGRPVILDDEVAGHQSFRD
jgi:hypothetical protein